MSYLRFTPEEYREVAHLCRTHRLAEGHLPGFTRRLVELLQASCPPLAARVARLRRAQLTLLFRHFSDGPAPSGARPELSPEEKRALAAACEATPFPVRFVRPFRGLLVEMLEGPLPDLARKLAQMSGHQFERLYNAALGRT